jgi:MFS family permease
MTSSSSSSNKMPTAEAVTTSGEEAPQRYGDGGSGNGAGTGGDDKHDDEPAVSWTNLAFIAAVANLGSLLFGYDFGATSWLLTRIAEYGTGFDDDQYRVFVEVAHSDGLTGFIAAGSSIGATMTFVFLLFFGNGIPKNDEIMLSALLYFVGALLESSSGDVSWRNYMGLSLLVAGRLLYGAGIALSFHSVPQYISEISPRVGRGSIGSLTEAMTVTGVVLGFLVGYLDQGGSGFVVTFRVGYLIAVVMGMLAMVLPRSPSWLARKGADDDEVLESLQFIRPSATLQSVKELRKSIEANNSDKLRWESKLRKMDDDPAKYPCASLVKTPEVRYLVFLPGQWLSRTL